MPPGDGGIGVGDPGRTPKAPTNPAKPTAPLPGPGTTNGSGSGAGSSL
jgi:hypothetical protein